MSTDQFYTSDKLGLRISHVAKNNNRLSIVLKKCAELRQHIPLLLVVCARFRSNKNLGKQNTGKKVLRHIT